MLSDSVRTSIRRHLNVPVPGYANTAFTEAVESFDSTVPYYTQPAAIDERMMTLRPTEESVITGMPLAEIILTATPSAVAMLGVTVTPESTRIPVSIGVYNAIASDLSAIEPLFSIASALVLAINESTTPYVAVIGPHTAGGPFVAAQAIIVLQGLTYDSFNVSLTSQGVAAYVASQGLLPPLSVTFRNAGGKTTVYGLVPILDYLEARIATSSDFAAFLTADVITFDPSEQVKREAQYRFYQRRLASLFFGSHGDQYLAGGRRGRGAIV